MVCIQKLSWFFKIFFTYFFIFPGPSLPVIPCEDRCLDRQAHLLRWKAFRGPKHRSSQGMTGGFWKTRDLVSSYSYDTSFHQLMHAQVWAARSLQNYLRKIIVKGNSASKNLLKKGDMFVLQRVSLDGYFLSPVVLGPSKVLSLVTSSNFSPYLGCVRKLVKA